MPQNKRKKTIVINEVVDMVNAMLEQGKLPTTITTGEFVHKDKDGNPQKVSPEDAYRIGLINVVEAILHQTSRYQGFGYDTKKFPDPMAPVPLERHYYKYED